MKDQTKSSAASVAISISAVIPVYNESGNLEKLDIKLKQVLSGLFRKYEIIYVNDGSTDDSLNKLRAFKNVTIINLNRNYGQATALDVGFKTTKGELVVSLDGDGQNDPADIPALIKALNESGADVATGWRQERHDSKHMVFLAKLGRLCRKLLIGDVIHDSGSTLRVYRQKAVKSLDLSGEMHRYVVALLRWKGYKIVEVPVVHHKRVLGKSNYGINKTFRAFVDLGYVWFIDTYSDRPLHFFGGLAILSFLAGILSAAWCLYAKLHLGIHLAQNGWFAPCIIFLISSIIFFSLGIIIDFLIKIHFNNSPHEQRYYIREIITNGH